MCQGDRGDAASRRLERHRAESREQGVAFVAARSRREPDPGLERPACRRPPGAEEVPIRVAGRLGRVHGHRPEFDRPRFGRRSVERQRLLLDGHEECRSATGLARASERFSGVGRRQREHHARERDLRHHAGSVEPRFVGVDQAPRLRVGDRDPVEGAGRRRPLAGRLAVPDREQHRRAGHDPDDDRERREPDDASEHRLPATDGPPEPFGRRGRGRDAPGVIVEHLSQVAFEIVHVSSLLGIRSRSVSIARATIDRTAAAEQPRASPACCSDRSA